MVIVQKGEKAMLNGKEGKKERGRGGEREGGRRRRRRDGKKRQRHREMEQESN